MPPSALTTPSNASILTDPNGGSPPAKRLRFASPLEESSGRDGNEILPHPLRIKPSGNAFTSPYNLRDISTGLFSTFPDELIIRLLGYLDASDLQKLGSTSKGMYGLCRCEELWKTLFIESPISSSHFLWQGTWRRTYLKLPRYYESAIPLPDLFSDVLYRPYHMSQISLELYVSNIPPKNQILKFSNLSSEEFEKSYSSTPFILTDPVKSWPGFKDWSVESMATRYGDVKFRAESVDWTLRDYISYMNDQTDESPLYLFDKAFVEKTNGEVESGITIPECFGHDFFEVLGEQRPDRRWMILGPSRSGSTFHKDPNATSAWNAIIFGEKYWIMFQPDSLPPGVFVSEDQSEVTSPLSIAEWLVSFHQEARRVPGCIEGICNAGEVLHVPSGWWHLVVNTKAALALTQNFVPRSQLPAVLGFLRDQPGSISGFDCSKVKDPYQLFLRRMEEQFPEELAEAMKKLDSKKRSKWDDLVAGKDDEGGFSFGFGDDSDNDD